MFTRTLAVLRKETREILRDPYTLGIALVLPLVLLVLLGYAINTDIKNIDLVVLDLDRTPASREYARAFVNSGYFRWAGAVDDYDAIGARLDGDEAEAALVIPPGFGEALSAGRAAQAQTLLDGSYTPFAQVASAYVDAINAAYAGPPKAVNPSPRNSPATYARRWCAFCSASAAHRLVKFSVNVSTLPQSSPGSKPA